MHYSALFYGLSTSSVPFTDSWHDYVLSDSIILYEYIATKPLIFLFTTIAFVYVIYKALFMLTRIYQVESEKSSLSKYFSPQIAEEITKSGIELNHGKKQLVTILFQDIRNFTSLSESISTEELTEFLSEFRERMTKIIFKHSGSVDKYIGDAVMATFGTPTPKPNDAQNAILASIDMIQSIRSWNQERVMANKPPLKTGIGIHSGVVFAGNIGFADRMEYTVIGDAVNTASRIEGLCKTYEADCILSEETRKLIQNFPTLPLPDTDVKGKGKPVQIHKLMID